MKSLASVLVTLTILLASCGTDKENERQPILMADREAPLGWVYLRIYEDSTFEFESRGLRTGKIYPGTINLKNDTIIFNYTDSIPSAGTKAVMGDKWVSYINGEYHERVEVKVNKLKNK